MAEALRQRAAEIFLRGVAAADPAASTASAIRGLDLRAKPRGRLAVLAVGKAAFGMTRAAIEVLGDRVRPADVLVVTHDEAKRLGHFDALRAGHPLPDERGQAAAREVERRAAELDAGDLALVLISGGASALLPAPAPGIGLDDKLETTRQLLRGGATIHELNAVRKHLSTTKGGGLLRQLRSTRVVTLALSDVIDDDPLRDRQRSDGTRSVDVRRCPRRAGTLWSRRNVPDASTRAAGGGRSRRTGRDAEAGRSRLRRNDLPHCRRQPDQRPGDGRGLRRRSRSCAT